MINLSSYDSLQTNIFVKISYPDTTFDYFSDYHREFSFGGDTYTGFGSLLSVAPTENNLRAAPMQVEVVLSGLPTTVIQNALASDLKGSFIEIFRAFFDAETGELLPVGENPAGKFRGVVNNFSIENNITMGDDTANVSILLECSSVLQYLENKIGGRRTNPLDQQAYDPTDTSMKRVPSLARSNFDFGAPK
jgi:hypothetical protein